MKKDIKWLNDKILTLKETYITARNNFELNSCGRSFYNGMLSSIGLILSFISELDETEVLLQEGNINIVLDDLKEHIKEQQILTQNIGLAHTSPGNDTHYRQYDYVFECINEYEPSDELQNLLVPKQELPVIPKYVAEWIEDLKSKEINLLENIYDFTHDEDISNYIREQGNTLMRAWLHGYEVEKEPLYFALIKGNELITDKGDWTFKYWKLDISNGHVFPSHQFTQQGNFLIKMSKKDWNNLGINDSNADFVEVV